MYSLDKEGKQDEEGIRAAAKDGGYEGRGVEECMVIVGYGWQKESHYMTRYPVFIIIILLVHIALEEIENSGTPSNRILLGNAKPFYHHICLST